MSGTDLQRSLVSGGTGPAYQLPGVDSSLPITETFCLQDQGSISSGVVRQQHSGQLHKQERGHEIQGPKHAGTKPDQLVFGALRVSDGCARGRCRQYGRRCVVSAMSGSPQGQVQVNRMVTRSARGRSALQEMGDSRPGSVCHGAQQKGAELLQSEASPTGGKTVSVGPSLGSGPVVSVPADLPPGFLPVQGRTRGGRGNPGGAMVAEKRLVCSAPQLTSGSAGGPPTVSGAPQGSGGAATPGPEDPKPSCLETFRAFLTKAGVSNAAADTIEASQRPSTRSLYQKKWASFLNWCQGRSLDPLNPSAADVLNYLQSLADLGLKYNTAKSHASALSSCCMPVDGYAVGSHPLVLRWLKGFLAIRPPVRLIMPPWDLAIILQALRQAPYEPLESVPLEFLTLKTAFLIAVTLARRISELHALCAQKPYTVLNPESAVLRVNPLFTPKCVSATAGNAVVELQAFHPNPTNDSEARLNKNCPVRALRIYKARTRPNRANVHQLFVEFNPDRLYAPASLKTIGSWLTKVIKDAYEHFNKTDLLKSNPHTLRSVATSWAEAKGISPENICRAATWSSQLTFAMFYRLDYLGNTFSSAVLQVAEDRPK